MKQVLAAFHSTENVRRASGLSLFNYASVNFPSFLEVTFIDSLNSFPVWIHLRSRARWFHLKAASVTLPNFVLAVPGYTDPTHAQPTGELA